MKSVIKALAFAFFVFSCAFGVGIVGEMLSTLTKGASRWAFAAIFFVAVFWFSYVAFREIDGAVVEAEAGGFEQIVGEVVRERYRQLERGYDAEHDATNDQGQLADAAACYAWNVVRPQPPGLAPFGWPWEEERWEPTTPRRDLLKAAALILAEIERLDRVRV